MSRQPTRLTVGRLVLVAVVAAVVVFLLLRWWAGRSGSLPPLSPPVAAILLVMAGALVAAGRRIRATVRGRTERPVDPIGAFRVLLVGQACALAGAVVTGGYLGFAGVAAPDADFPSVRTALLTAVALAFSGVLLAASGLWVQHVCRIDHDDREDPEDDDEERGDLGGAGHARVDGRPERRGESAPRPPRPGA